MEFKEQYKHPLWQKKRLEALEAAKFTCNRCFDDESQLHVHHKRYISGRKVWEYENSELEVLCDKCHSLAHDDKERFLKIQGRVCSEGLNEIANVLTGYLEKRHGPVGTGFSSSEINLGDPNSFDILIGRLAAAAANNLGLICVDELATAIESLGSGERKSFTLVCPPSYYKDDSGPF